MLVLKGRVIDATGNDPIEQGIVVVEGNRITAVCNAYDFVIPENAEVIDVGNGTIMPGFNDQHCHMGSIGESDVMRAYARNTYERTCQAVYDMSKMLEAGFTSIRELGGFANRMKSSVEKGLIKAPRIFAAGHALTQTGGHDDAVQQFPISFMVRNDCAVIADGVDEVRRACRTQFREGADVIKVSTTGGVLSQGDNPLHCQYSMDEIRAMVEEADMHGTYVAAHAQTLRGIKNALRGGIKSIEHGIELDDEAIELILKNDAWVVPTFSIGGCLQEKVDFMPLQVAEKVKWAKELHMKSINKAYKAGVKLGFGSDLISDTEIAPYGEKCLMEFVHLSNIGMSPMETIIAATRTGAEIILRGKELGTLEVGKLADITVCAGNPLEDIKVLTKIDNIKLVLQDGKIIKNLLS